MTANIVSLKPDAQPKRRVLVVEDNLDSVHSMAVLIKMMGHEVEFAINGLAALDIAKTFKPDVILLDIGLPDFKGDTIAKQLKDHCDYWFTDQQSTGTRAGSRMRGSVRQAIGPEYAGGAFRKAISSSGL